MTPLRLKELLEYNPKSGVVSRKTSGKALMQDYAGFVSVYDPSTKKTTKLKLKKIAAFFAYTGSTYSSGDRGLYDTCQVVLHKNMQEDDYTASNLIYVPAPEYRLIQEAYRNINESIKLTAHPTDQFSYILHWYQNGAMRSKVIQDVVVAKREMLKLKLKYSKILTACCVFD